MLFWSVKFSVSPATKPTRLTTADESVEEALSVTIRFGAMDTAAPPPWNVADVPGVRPMMPSVVLKFASACSAKGALTAAAAGVVETSSVQLAGSALPITCVAASTVTPPA